METNNQSAFPIGKQIQMCEQGMSLRDYFAAKAMQGVLASGSIKEGIPNNTLAEYFYKFADEMLKQREL